MNKLVTDTLMENGAYSMKRVSAFVAFWIAQLYIILVHIFHWEVMQFVYEWLMGWAAYVITGTVIDKKLINKATLFGAAQPATVETKTESTTTIKTNAGKQNDDIG